MSAGFVCRHKLFLCTCTCFAHGDRIPSSSLNATVLFDDALSSSARHATLFSPRVLPLTRVDAILGMPALRNMRALVDCYMRRLWIKPPPQADRFGALFDTQSHPDLFEGAEVSVTPAAFADVDDCAFGRNWVVFDGRFLGANSVLYAIACMPQLDALPDAADDVDDTPTSCLSTRVRATMWLMPCRAALPWN